MIPRSIPRSWNDVLTHNLPLVCGIVNVTPDSFSDGGNYISDVASRKLITQLISDGASMIDIGAESTRPGAQEVTSDEEISRLKNVFEHKSAETYTQLFSIDTRHHETARVAIDNGFHVINDVSGATFDLEMKNVIAETSALCVLMHTRGTPETMMNMSTYGNVVDDVTRELEDRVEVVSSSGVDIKKIMVDPGIGFAKTPEDNLELIENCSVIKKRLGLPMMVGVSRKSVVSFLLNGDKSSASMKDRDVKTAELSLYFANCGIDVIRVHDVGQSVRALSAHKDK